MCNSMDRMRRPKIPVQVLVVGLKAGLDQHVLDTLMNKEAATKAIHEAVIFGQSKPFNLLKPEK